MEEPFGDAISLSEGLMRFALQFPTEQVPEDVFDWAALRLVDTVGVAVCCSSNGLGTAALDMVENESVSGRSSVWTTGRLASSRDAAMANGMLSHGMDYDDTHTMTTLHPSIVMVPTALALGEELGASGRDTLAAAVIGYEVTTRLGRLATGQFQLHGFHPTSALGIFGAVAIASRLYEVSLDVAVNACGLAGSMASGLMEYLSDGTDAKQMHPGWAASAAVAAVKLAQHGGSGPRLVLEGDRGVFKSFADVIDLDIAQVYGGLGENWFGSQVATKPYPACHCVHAPVDSWLTLREKQGWTDADVADVRRIVGLVPSWYPQLVCDPLRDKQRPRSVYEARFSLPFSIALAVVDGGIGSNSYASDRLSDRRLLDVAARVEYEIKEYDEFPEAFPGGIRVEFDDGRVYEEELRHNRGSVGNPLTRDEIRDKFLDCAQSVDGSAAEELLEALLASSTAPDLSAFTNAMRSVRVSRAGA